MPSNAVDVSEFRVPLNDHTTCECNSDTIDGGKRCCFEKSPSGLPAM